MNVTNWIDKSGNKWRHLKPWASSLAKSQNCSGWSDTCCPSADSWCNCSTPECHSLKVLQWKTCSSGCVSHDFVKSCWVLTVQIHYCVCIYDCTVQLYTLTLAMKTNSGLRTQIWYNYQQPALQSQTLKNNMVKSSHEAWIATHNFSLLSSSLVQHPIPQWCTMLSDDQSPVSISNKKFAASFRSWRLNGVPSRFSSSPSVLWRKVKSSNRLFLTRTDGSGLCCSQT